MDSKGDDPPAAAPQGHSETSLVRIEVEAAERDSTIIRALADRLRGEPAKAEALRAMVENALVALEPKDAFEAFGSDLSDEVFSGIFDQPRYPGWRPIDL